jgi:hypothetical protein
VGITQVLAGDESPRYMCHLTIRDGGVLVSVVDGQRADGSRHRDRAERGHARTLSDRVSGWKDVADED